MKFENVNYNNTVGNIILEIDSLIYETDCDSDNDSEICEKILINEINKCKLKSEMNNNNFGNIIIETKDKKYKFEFNYQDLYKKFVEILNILVE